MNIKKIIGTFMAAVGLGMTIVAPSMAQQMTFATVAGGGPGASSVFTYSGGSGGTFSTTVGSQFASLFSPTLTNSAPDVLTFTGFSASGFATGSGTTLDPYRQGLGMGGFTLTGGGNTLLTGTFTGGNVLTAITSATSAAITNTVNNVTYTGGTYFAAAGLNNPGSFSIAMTSVAPPPTVLGGYLTNFTAGGSVNFSATQPSTVPEPASVIPFALGGLGLLGLIVRKTRRTNGAAA